jgi:outer membrane receptor protein involved in Fe transport
MMGNLQQWLRSHKRSCMAATGATILALVSGNAWAQAVEDEGVVDEITVTGSQIKGARINDALAVTIISAEDIEVMGIESGDELLDMIPESGQNFFSEADTAGSVNAARGDVGAINLRNLGTGNTLVLLNGRRLVNMATYQTERVGGSLVPVNSVNSNHIPVFGVERVEILRDGASAIYGADAVAGVINTVLKDDVEGLTIRARYSDYDNLPRNDEALSIEWGKGFNGGATHVGVFARHYKRDRINSQDDPRWANSDFRYRFPEDSPYSTSTQFRNNSVHSLWGQFDLSAGVGSTHSLRTTEVVDNLGEFEIFPIGDSRCTNTDPDAVAAVYDLQNGNCLHEDGQGNIRYNLNDNRDLSSELERTTVFAYFNHEMDSGLEMFGDVYFYTSTTNRINTPITDLGAVPLRVGASNYYNPFGPVGSPSRLADPTGEIYADVPDEGLEVGMDFYRFGEYPRITDNDGDAARVLFGLRGSTGDWDWESAVTWSEATRDDITHNRLSNTLMSAALFDPTPAAYNPFSAGVDSNIEQALVDMYRKGKSDLSMFDVKFSNPELFEMPAGSAAFLAGFEYRRESYVDDRDPRLDGTIRFMRDPDLDGIFDVEGDFEGDTYPLTSDIVGASPTPDGKGSRTTNSLFTELQLPILDTLDVQLALRYEDFDDIGDTTVGKVAFGWRPVDQLLFRGSWSEAFRAPNLITINEEFVARSNGLNDYFCFYGEDQGTLDATCNYSIQRQATGSKDLVPEKSVNTSIGVVIEPVENLTFTLDFWSIEKDDTIGLFGEENHILYDLVLRLEAGTANCASVQGNPAVVRRDFDVDDTGLVNGYLAAGLCPAGTVDYVSDIYTNLDTRTVRGYDIGAYYDVDTSFGSFYFRYNGAFYTEFKQTATGELSTTVLAAKEANPTITYPLDGLGNLLGIDGFQENRHSASVTWSKGDLAASLTGFRISGFEQILSSGAPFYIPSMTTFNAKFGYSFDIGDTDMRVQLGVNNLADERAPIADESYGFAQDAHRDFGRYAYLDLRIRL